MSLPLRVRPAAQAELSAAVAWYEGKRPGLGAAFAAAVRPVLDAAAATPEFYPVAEGDTREAPVPGYPYCAYYRVRLGELVVIAIYHQSRDPSGWRGRT